MSDKKEKNKSKEVIGSEPSAQELKPSAEEPKSSTSASKPSNSKTSKQKNTSSAASRSVFPVVISFLFFLLLVVIGLLTYYGWEWTEKQESVLQQVEANVNQQLRILSQNSQKTSKVLADQQKVLADITQLQQQQSQQAQQLQQRLATHSQRLKDLSGRSRDVWLLEEARYLLRLANHQQLTGGQRDSILGLMSSADNILSQVDNPSLFDIRNTIAREQAALQSATEVDREGLYLQINALSEQIVELTQNSVLLNRSSIESQNKSQTVSDMVEVENMPWYRRVQQSFKKTFSEHIDRYVRIEQHDQSLAPLLSNQEKMLIILEMQLAMEQAQLSLLQQYSQAYEGSLSKVENWFTTYFAHIEGQASIIKQLQKLQQEKITGYVPDISQSLVQLDRFIQRHQFNPSPQPHNTNQNISGEKL